MAREPDIAIAVPAPMARLPHIGRAGRRRRRRLVARRRHGRVALRLGGRRAAQRQHRRPPQRPPRPTRPGAARGRGGRRLRRHLLGSSLMTSPLWIGLVVTTDSRARVSRPNRANLLRIRPCVQAPRYVMRCPDASYPAERAPPPAARLPPRRRPDDPDSPAPPRAWRARRSFHCRASPRTFGGLVERLRPLLLKARALGREVDQLGERQYDGDRARAPPGPSPSAPRPRAG